MIVSDDVKKFKMVSRFMNNNWEEYASAKY